MKKVFSMLLLLCGFLTLSAVALNVNAAEIVSYKLVTDASELTIGSTIIITDTDVAFALSETQGTNNRVAVAITKSSDGSIPVTEGVQDIKLGEGNQTDTIAFNVGNGYLYAAGGTKNNYLRTEETKSDKSSWTISLNTESEATIICKDSGTTKNSLQYNSSSKIFSCYSTIQKAVKIYKRYVETAGEDEVATVKFFMNNGTEVIVKEDTIAKGNSVLFPENPVRPGYIFLGWYDAATDGNKVESLVLEENTNLYAHWEVDPHHHLIINSDEVQKLPNAGGTGYGPYNGSHTASTGEEFSSSQVMPQTGVLQFQASAGCIYNVAPLSGTIAHITLDIEVGSYTVSTSATALTSNGENVETLTSTNNKLVVASLDHSYFYIKKSDSGTGKINSIDIAYTYVEKTTYTVSFNPGVGVSFKPGKGESITANKGDSTEVTLPTQDDIVQTPYKYTILSSWNGQINRKPGETVVLSEDIAYTALYVAPENLTIAQAIEVAEITGSTATTISFSTTATVSVISGKNVTITDSSTAETFIVYNPSGATLNVGDVVTFTGKIKTYNETKEYDAPKAVLVKASYVNAFEQQQTKASLKLTDSVVSIRFGNMISATAFKDTATYGVVVSKNQADLQNLTVDSIETLKTAGQGCVCVPVRVNAAGEEDANGEYYQFALVLTDVPASEYAETLYATMYMIVDGTVYTAQVKQASVKSVAAAYLAGDTSRFSANTLEILNNLAA